MIDKCEIIPATTRPSVFEVRVYDGHPDKGGKIKETVKPKLEMAKSWYVDLNRKLGYLEPYDCKMCGKPGMKRHPTRKFCDKCAKTAAQAVRNRKNLKKRMERQKISREKERERLKKLKAERGANKSKG